MVDSEPRVRQNAPMPKGYGFLAKGDQYRTGLCRRLTQAAKKQVYVVVDRKNNAVGIRAPTEIISDVDDQDRATRDQRRAAVQRRDVATRSDFETAILGLFPKIPPQDLEKVLDRALKKRSGRVGRTGKLTVDSKARLAVTAHVRHHHTNYDVLLRQEKKRQGVARQEILPKLTQVCQQWKGGVPKLNGGDRVSRGKTRKDTLETNGPSMTSTRSSRQASLGKTIASRRNGKSSNVVSNGRDGGGHQALRTEQQAPNKRNGTEGAPTLDQKRRKKRRRGKKRNIDGGVPNPITDAKTMQEIQQETRLKTRQETRHTRSAANRDKAKLLGPDDLVTISSDESGQENTEDESSSEEESMDSFVISDYSDSLMDEEWEDDEE